MNYKKLTNVDVTDPDAVAEAIKNICEKDDMVSEQKLFAIGLIIQKNKENYISRLKSEISELKKKIENLKSDMQPKTSEPKKKVVIVRKK